MNKPIHYSALALLSMSFTNLGDLLENQLILRHLGPYLGVHVLRLAATSKRIRRLIYDSPEVLTYLDLCCVRSLHSANVKWHDRPQWYDNSDSDLTEQDFFAQPLNYVLSSLGTRILSQVRTLNLDGLYVSTKILVDLFCKDSFSIRLLSLRGIQGLSNSAVLRVLRYAFRNSRPPGVPSVRGLYCCTPVKQVSSIEKAFRAMTVIGEHEHFVPSSVMTRTGASLGAGTQASAAVKPQFDPYQLSPYAEFGCNENISTSFSSSDHWATFILACQGFLSFDIVLCTGNHPPEVATVRLQGCQSCGSCPEKPAYPNQSVCGALFFGTF